MDTGGGVAADLASALATEATSGDAAKKTAAAAAEKPAAKEKPQSTDAGDEGDESTGSGIMDTIREMQNKQDGIDDSDNPGHEGEQGEAGDDSPDGEITGFEEVDTNIPSSGAIKGKFKRFKDNERALKKAHADSQALLKKTSDELKALQDAQGAADATPATFEESDAYKDFEKRTTDAEAIVERLRLEESPRFKEKYDNKIQKSVASVQPFLKAIKDEGLREITIQHLDATVQIPAGEDNDPAFYAAIGEISEAEGFPAHLKAPLFTKLVEMRGVINDRHAAVANHRETAKGYATEQTVERGKDVDAALATYKQSRATYEAANADRLNVYRAKENVAAFQYDEQVGPGHALLEQELKISVEAGGPSPNLIALAQRGTEFNFQQGMMEKIGTLYKNTAAENVELKKQLAKLKGGGTGGGSKTGSAGGGEKEESSGSGIIDTMREMANA